LAVADISRVCRDLVISGKQAAWAHCSAAAILLILGLSGSIAVWRVAFLGTLVVACALLRLAVALRQDSWNPNTWLTIYTAMSVTNTFIWGCFLAVLILKDGWNSPVALATMLMMTGFSAGGLATLAPNRILHNSFQLALWGPPLLTALIPKQHGPGFFLPTIFSIFLAYLLVSGKQYHHKYLTDVRRESDLERARAAAETASQSKSAFVANISHEIRTPLNGVLGMLELSLLEQMSASQRESLESAHTSARSLLGLLNDLLDFSKIEAGRIELERIDFDVRDLGQPQK
jgi:signal transduction histidine kinase